MFQDIVLDDDDPLHVGPYLTRVEKVDTKFTLKTFTKYLHGKFKPEVVMAYHPEGDGLFRFTLTFYPPWSERYYVEVRYVNYWGRDYEWLGLFNEKDSLFLRVRYMW